MRFFHLSLMLWVLTLITPATLFGAEFYRKQTGNVTLPNGSSQVTVTIAPVDKSQSFLVFSMSPNSEDPDFFLVAGQITNANTLTFSRVGTSVDVVIQWQVFEFQGGVYVQHGSANGAVINPTFNIPINCVDLTKSFVLVSGAKAGNILGPDDALTANLNTSTNLQLTIDGGTATYPFLYWQVIEYRQAVVKKVTATMAAGFVTATSAIVPPISNLGKAFIVSTHTVNADIPANSLPRTELTNVSTVTYTRVGNVGALNFITYVVEFTDNSTATRGSIGFASSGALTLERNVAVTAGVSSGVIGPGHNGWQGTTNRATLNNPGDDNVGHAWFEYELTSPTNLRIRRSAPPPVPISTATAPWQVVTFEDTGLQQETFYSRASGAWEANTSWSFTDASSPVPAPVPVGVFPRRTDNVVIKNGHTITIDNITDNGPCSTSPNGLGRTNVGGGGTPFPDAGTVMFYHTGDVIVSAGGTLAATVPVMLEGYTLVENSGAFTLTNIIVNLGYLETQPTATFTNGNDLVLSGNSVTILNNTSVGFDDLIIDWPNATLCGNGVLNLGNGSGNPNVRLFNGANINQICTSISITCTLNCVSFPVTPTGNFLAGNLGPGGVGNSTNNRLWLRANDLSLTNGASVNSWPDASGNGLTAVSSGVPAEAPTFATNTVNTILPAISFDGGDFLNLGNPAVLNLIPQGRSWSFFAAYNVPGVTPEGTFLAKATFLNRQYQYTIDDNAGSSRFTTWVGGNQSIGSVVATNAWFVSSGTNTTTQKDSWTNENVNLAAQGVGATQEQTADVLIGARRDTGPTTGTGFRLTGSIAEMAMYDVLVNDAQRIIVSNYLAAKYNIALLPANDVYAMDNPGNGNYDFDVAGIGQAANGSNHRDARGSGIVRMWNPTNLGNGEFLLWGHDNTTLLGPSATTTAGVDGTIIEERISRIWRVSEIGEVGTVSISFDFSILNGSPLGSNLRLLIDRDGDGFTDNDVLPIVGTLSNDIAVFSGIDFQNGDRFTLGNRDTAFPLPVELISFQAIAQQGEVKLKWSTASELNNDFFTIQRSQDAEAWHVVGNTIRGKGTRNYRTDYEITDGLPLTGVSYYRLKQTDLDGKFTYSVVRRVEVLNTFQLKVYPNPSKGEFRVSTGFEIYPEDVQLTNMVGQTIPVKLEADGNSVLVQSKSFSPGMYILRVSKGYWKQAVRVVIE